MINRGSEERITFIQSSPGSARCEVYAIERGNGSGKEFCTICEGHHACAEFAPAGID